MPVDPFAALGIAQEAAPPPSVMTGGDMPTLTVKAKRGGVDPFAALGIDENAVPDVAPEAPRPQGIAANLAAGANSQIFSGLGAPVDLMTGALNLGGRAVNAVTGSHIPPIENPVGGADWLSSQFGRFSVDPRAVQPQTEGENVAHAIGGGIAALPMMALGAGGIGAAIPQGVAPVTAGALQSLKTMPVGPALLPTAGGSALGQMAEDVAPEDYKPLANVAGNLVGAGLTGGAQLGGGILTNKALSAGGRMGIGRKADVGGVRATASQADAAASQVRSALGQEGIDRLQSGEPDSIVPGSMPTTAQVVQTPGAVALDKAHRVASPEPFQERAQQQNAARLASVQGLAPVDAQPGAVGQFFAQQLRDLDAQGAQATTAARGAVQGQTEALGGQQPTAAYGDQIRGAVETAREPVHAATSRLWAAVDPEGTWALPSGGVREAAQNLIREISPTAQTDAQETGLLQRAATLPEVVRFRDIGDIRADINAAMRRLAGSPGYETNVRRLTLLKQGLDQTLADAVEGRAAQEAEAVAAGQMTPEQTMMGRFGAKAQEWYAARDAQARAVGSGGIGGEGSGEYAGAGPSAIPGARGAAGQARGGPGNLEGNPSLPGQAQPLEPNITPEHGAAYQAANAATRAEHERFSRGAVGQIQRKGRQGEDYAVQSGAVPGKIFTRGPTEPGEVARFIEAVGGPEQASQIGREALANELRQAGIIKPDGTLNADSFARWQAKRDATISQFPGLKDQFSSVEAAQRTLDDVTAGHKAAVDEFQRSAAAKFINDDPSKAVGSAFGSRNPTETFGQLVRGVRGNADAEAGLRRAVVDYITEKTRSATPAGEVDFQKAATFRNFIRQNNGALKQLFGGQGVQNLEMVAADLRRQAQQSTATAGSDTAQNIAAARKYGTLHKVGHNTALGMLMLAGEHIGSAVHGGFLGSAVGAVALPLAGEAMHALRQAGITTINDLVREAMLHPQLARELMARPRNGQIGPMAARRIAASLQAVIAAQSGTQEKMQ